MIEYYTIGRKLGHSYSKLIHEAFGRYEFDLKELEPEEAAEFIAHGEYRGITVTIPYKRLALEKSDEVSPIAARIGCANTVVRGKDGKLRCFNTDYPGFRYMCAKAGISFKGAKVLILGSGGTSLTARTVIADEGAREIVIVSRKGPVDYGNVVELHGDAELIVNTTPVGMFPETEQSPLDLTCFKKLRGVVDVVYNPMRTRLKLQARSLGLQFTDGLVMLVSQARYCMEHFLDEKQSDVLVDNVCEKIRKMTSNVVLIGMPGVGKSTVGREIALKEGKEFVDTDELIIARAGKSIERIFHEEGEAAFRAMESEVIADVCRKTNLVIATGGGAVISERNRLNMAQNGFVYWLKRPLECLQLGNGRPLSTDLDSVKKIYAEREPLYAAAADFLMPLDNH